jgi:hypothetical protein
MQCKALAGLKVKRANLVFKADLVVLAPLVRKGQWGLQVCQAFKVCEATLALKEIQVVLDHGAQKGIPDQWAPKGRVD